MKTSRPNGMLKKAGECGVLAAIGKWGVTGLHGAQWESSKEHSVVSSDLFFTLSPILGISLVANFKSLYL